MPVKNSGKKKKIEFRRTKVAALYNQGVTSQNELSRRLKIPLTTIHRDMEALSEEWRQAAAADINEAKIRILAKITMAQEECWKEWKKSKKEFLSVTERTVPVGGESGEVTQKTIETTTKKEKRSASHQHMANYTTLIKQEMTVYGIDSSKLPDSTNQQDRPDPTQHLNSLPPAQAVERYDEMIAALTAERDAKKAEMEKAES